MRYKGKTIAEITRPGAQTLVVLIMFFSISITTLELLVLEITSKYELCDIQDQLEDQNDRENKSEDNTKEYYITGLILSMNAVELDRNNVFGHVSNAFPSWYSKIQTPPPKIC